MLAAIFFWKEAIANMSRNPIVMETPAVTDDTGDRRVGTWGIRKLRAILSVMGQSDSFLIGLYDLFFFISGALVSFDSVVCYIKVNKAVMVLNHICTLIPQAVKINTLKPNTCQLRVVTCI